MAESEGFEPSVGCPTQHFQCCTLRPLGQLSIIGALCNGFHDRLIIKQSQAKVSRLFYFP